ncbi:hypothetical protein BG015_005047, partial [Linnemannia schmuckeri]
SPYTMKHEKQDFQLVVKTVGGGLEQRPRRQGAPSFPSKSSASPSLLATVSDKLFRPSERVQGNLSRKSSGFRTLRYVLFHY